MAIKVVVKSTRPNPNIGWYNMTAGNYLSSGPAVPGGLNIWWREETDDAYSSISKSVSSSNPSTFIERTHPDDLTMIRTFSWTDLSTYNTAMDYDASSDSAWKSYVNDLGTYEESNSITTIRYIYDASDNLTSTQKRVNKVYWENYSE